MLRLDGGSEGGSRVGIECRGRVRIERRRSEIEIMLNKKIGGPFRRCETEKIKRELREERDIKKTER